MPHKRQPQDGKGHWHPVLALLTVWDAWKTLKTGCSWHIQDFCWLTILELKNTHSYGKRGQTKLVSKPDGDPFVKFPFNGAITAMSRSTNGFRDTSVANNPSTGFGWKPHCSKSSRVHTIYLVFLWWWTMFLFLLGIFSDAFQSFHRL